MYQLKISSTANVIALDRASLATGIACITVFQILVPFHIFFIQNNIAILFLGNRKNKHGIFLNFILTAQVFVTVDF